MFVCLSITPFLWLVSASLCFAKNIFLIHNSFATILYSISEIFADDDGDFLDIKDLFGEYYDDYYGFEYGEGPDGEDGEDGDGLSEEEKEEAIAEKEEAVEEAKEELNKAEEEKKEKEAAVEGKTRISKKNITVLGRVKLMKTLFLQRLRPQLRQPKRQLMLLKL